MDLRLGLVAAEWPGAEPVALELLTHPDSRLPEIFLLREAQENQGGPLSEAMVKVIAQNLHRQYGIWRTETEPHTLYVYNRRSRVWDEYTMGVADDRRSYCAWVGAAPQYEVEKKLGGESLARSRQDHIQQCANDLAYLESRQGRAPRRAPSASDRAHWERAYQDFAPTLCRWLDQGGRQAWAQFLQELKAQYEHLRHEQEQTQHNPYRRF